MNSSIEEVIERLNSIIAECKTTHNRNGYFPALYHRVTIEVKNKISENFFDDNERMSRLIVVFGKRYLDAYDNFHNSSSCSASWKVAFEASQSWRPLVIQHLFLGINAHISFDLGIAAAEIAHAENISTLKNDFYKINSILSSLVDDVETRLENIWPMLKFIDRLAGKLDEELAAFSINIARDAAWEMALQLASLKDEKEKENFLMARDKAVAAFAIKLYRPGIIVSAMISLIRFAETGTVKSKIEELEI